MISKNIFLIAIMLSTFPHITLAKEAVYHNIDIYGRWMGVIQAEKPLYLDDDRENPKMDNDVRLCLENFRGVPRFNICPEIKEGKEGSMRRLMSPVPDQKFMWRMYPSENNDWGRKSPKETIRKRVKLQSVLTDQCLYVDFFELNREMPREVDAPLVSSYNLWRLDKYNRPFGWVKFTDCGVMTKYNRTSTFLLKNHKQTDEQNGLMKTDPEALVWADIEDNSIVDSTGWRNYPYPQFSDNYPDWKVFDNVQYGLSFIHSGRAEGELQWGRSNQRFKMIPRYPFMDFDNKAQ